jgi:hypothetical protein
LQITAANVCVRGVIICRGGACDKDAIEEAKGLESGESHSPSKEKQSKAAAPAAASPVAVEALSAAAEPDAIHARSASCCACVEVHGGGFVLEMWALGSKTLLLMMMVVVVVVVVMVMLMMLMMTIELIVPLIFALALLP